MAGCRQGKTAYATTGEARAAIRGMRKDGRAVDTNLSVYRCPDADHYHLSKQVRLADKFTYRKPNGPAPFTPSSSKLRRKLENAAAQIAATQRRLTAAEKSYFEELDFVERETARIFGSK